MANSGLGQLTAALMLLTLVKEDLPEDANEFILDEPLIVYAAALLPFMECVSREAKGSATLIGWSSEAV